MHKQELITQVAKAAEVSQQKAATVIDAVIHAITNAMAAGESVSLGGLRLILRVGASRASWAQSSNGCCHGYPRTEKPLVQGRQGVKGRG